MSLHGKNILILAYKFPPLKSVGSQRLWKWYRSWNEVSRKTVVLTTSNRRHVLTDGSFPQGVDLEEIPTWDYRRVLASFPSGKGSHFATSWKQNILLSQLRNSLEIFPWNIIWGEGGAWYIWQAYRRAVRRIEQEGIQIILSSHHPFSDHIIAWLLKRKFPQLTWIADFRDIRREQTRALNSRPDGNGAIEERLLKKADIVTTVSHGLKRFLEQWHDQVYVLYNGFDHIPESIAPVVQQFFTLSYTGSIYPDLQDASPLFRSLQELITAGEIDRERLQFVTSGPDDVYWRDLAYRFELTDVLIHKGLVKRKEALAQQKQSHINVLLSWNYPTLKGILTSKLFEYLRIRRPIFALINGEIDPEFEGIFEQARCGEIFYTSDENLRSDLKESLKYYYNRWLHSSDWPAVSDAWQFDMNITAYHWRRQFRQFLEKAEDAALSKKRRS